MTVSVTMLQSRWGEDGTLWTVNSVHNATDEFATYLVTNGFAVGTLPPAQQSFHVSALRVAPGELSAADPPIPVNTLLCDRTTGLIYGQSDGAGGYLSTNGASMISVSYPGAVGSLVEV